MVFIEHSDNTFTATEKGETIGTLRYAIKDSTAEILDFSCDDTDILHGLVKATLNYAFQLPNVKAIDFSGLTPTQLATLHSIGIMTTDVTIDNFHKNKKCS
jgi:hypothetical protein